MPARSRNRWTAAASATGALALLITGCGGNGSTDDNGKDTPGGTTASPAAAHRLPLKSASHQTTWTGTGSKQGAFRLKLTAKSLERGARADLSQVQLGEDLAGMVPYYLTVAYTNTGKTAITSPDPVSDTSVAGPDGQAAERLTVMRSDTLATGSGLPSQCDQPAPATLAPGDTAEVCQVFMLPKKTSPTTVAYSGDESGTILWRVGDGRKKDESDGVLPAHKPVDSVWTDSDDRPVTVRVTPKSIRAGTIADLSRFKLDADQKKQIPYYVTVEYRNTGQHRLYPGLRDGVILTTAGGQPTPKLTLLDLGGDGVTQCPKAVPNEMVAPDHTVAVCSIHILPKGDRPATLTYRGEGSEPATFTWDATAGNR